jgi:SprB repeat/Secretion system C-terminal sorting domain
MRKLLALSLVLLLHITASVAQGSWTFAAPSDGAGSTGPETARAICNDASGNVYIVGNFNGSGVPTDFDLNSSSTNTATASSVDGFIASYDKNGNFRWKTIISGTSIDFGTPAGGVCTNGTFVWVTGTANVSAGAAQIISSTNTVTITSPGTGVDAFIAKLNCSNGSVQWQQGFGGSGANDIAQGVCIDPSGCAYVVGAYSSAFTLGSVSFPAPGGASDFFIAKFTPGGVLRAVQTGGSTTSNDMIANGGNVCFVPGTTPAIVAVGHSSASAANYGAFTGLGNFGLNDAMLVELDTALGAFTNALVMGSSAADELLGCTYDPVSGGVFVSGYCSGNITFPGTAALTGLGGLDITIARYTVASNNFAWSSIAGGLGSERGWSLAADGYGGILLAGFTASTPCTFSGSVNIPTNAGGSDVFVTKYNASGTPAWVLSAGGTGTEEARSISSYVETVPTFSQNLFITGITTTTGLSFGSFPVGNDGGSDFFLAKINDAAAPLTATQSQVNLTCNAVCNGSATVVASGGTSPYSYSWTPSGGSAATASSLCAGSYTCTITDANSVSITKTFTITQPPAIVLNANSQTNIACFGGNNGAASVVPATGGAGGFTYNWTPGNPTGDGTVSVSGLIAGTWTCTVTDANACTSTRTFNITQPSAISVTPASQTNISCNGGNNGAASINTPTGGAGGFTYNWTPGNPTGDGTVSVTGLVAGTWTCTITDANACTATQTFNITQPTALVVSPASQTNVSCFGGSNGAASVTVSGGTTAYSYNWTPGNPTGDGTAAVTGLVAGTWTCTVTDANSCTATRTFNITSPTAIVLSAAAQTNVSCFGGNNGAASINTPTGGAGGFTYNWTPGNPTGDGTVSVSGLTAGTWTCTVTDANSCTATQTFNITSPTAIVVTAASQTNILCNGGSNGAASINTPTGGAGGYSYNWTPGNPTGDGTVSVTGLTAGTWTCTVTDANSCTATQTFNITQPTAITASIGATQTSCTVNNGTATVSGVSGGAGSYTYSWAPSGGTAATATGLAAGNYTCTITDANLCSITRTVNVTTSSGPSLTAAALTNVSCFGGNNGAASVNAATGGTAPYTYNWTPGNPTGDGTVAVAGLTAGTWTCTVTDAGGCSSTVTFNITQPPALVVSPVSQTNISCNGGANGAASVTVNGGTPTYSYNWTPGNPTGDGTASVTGLTAGTWTCTVTDANSCTATQTFNITQPSALVVSALSQTNISCNGGTNGAASVSVSGGTTAYTYNWTPGNPTGDGTASVTGLVAGTWTCTVTDANACTATQTFNITQPSALVVSTLSQTNISCNGGTNGAASVSVSGGTTAYNYNWTPGNPTGDGTASVTGLTAGTWTCTVTDANSCTATQTFNITQPTALVVTPASQTNVSCFGGSNGAASVTVSGGTTAYSYNWTPGNPTGDGTASVTGLIAGTWTCTVTDANSCTATRTFNITSPTAIVVTPASQTNVSCFGGNNGAASINTPTGGAGGFTYNWTPGNPTGDGTVSVTGLTAGSWTCTVTDANACTATQTFNITSPTALVVTAASQTNILCNGGSNGAASINTPTGGAGGYSYNWTPGNPTGDGTVSVTGLTAGTWTCTVTDANSCTATQTFNITQPTAITASIGATQTSCTSNTGTATVSGVSGGAGSYTYSWAPSGGTAATATGLAAGNYTCTITDANLCTITRTVNVTTLAGPSLTAAAQTNVSCFGGNNGAASVNAATGGTAPYTYNWTPGNPTGDGTVSVTGLIAGTWTCTVTDAAGCTATVTFNITQPPALTVNPASQTNVSCFAGNNGAASVTVSGGTPGYSYNWTPGNPTGDGTAAVTGLVAGTWTCTVTDANSCVATRTFNITQPTPISATPTLFTNVSCNGGNNGAISLLVTGGTPGYSYNWTPGNPTGDGTPSVTGLTAGVWTCTITDANGCVLAPSFTILQPTVLSVPATATPAVICAGQSSTLSATATGGTASYAYNWQPINQNGPTQIVTPLVTTIYTVTVTDANGCTATNTVQVTVNPLPLVTLSGNSSFCAGGSTVLTGTSGGTSQWYRNGVAIPGANATTYTATLAGVYNMIKTNANTCADSAAAGITVTINPLPVITSSSSVAPLCNGGNNGQASVTATGIGTLTYNWLPSGGNAATANALTAGTYTCTVTDGNSCQQTQTLVVTQPSAITTSVDSVLSLQCNGASTGVIGISASGGTGTLTFSWAPAGGNAAVATGLAAGTYTCTVTDANNCSTQQTAVVTQPAAITTTVSALTNATCFGFADGSAAVNAAGGTGSLNYNWLPAGGNASSASGLAAGTYTVVVTDSNSCSTLQILTITEPPAFGLAVTSNPAALCIGNTATLTATVQNSVGVPVITWTPQLITGSSIQVSPTVTTTYTATVTDSSVCISSAVYTLVVSPQPVVTLGSDTTYCSSSAPIVLSGPSGAWMYSWQDGSTGQNFAVNSGAVYVLTVSDSSGACSSTDSVSISFAPSPVVSLNDTTACATSLTLCGPAGNYLYAWNTGATTQCIVYTAPSDTLMILVTDPTNGCTAMDTALVTLLTPPVASIIVPAVICVDDAPVTIITNPAGGILNGPGLTGNSFNPGSVSPGMQVFSYYYMDANGCDVTVTDSILVDPCTGVSENAEVTGISVYPNPANEIVFLTTTENGTAEIINELGQIIDQIQITSSNSQLNTSGYASGLYLIRYTTLTGKTQQIRLALQH